MVAKDDIENLLIMLGAPLNLKGYAYTLEALFLLCQEDYFENHNLGDVYELVGISFGVSKESVYKDISRFFEHMRDNFIDYDATSRYIGFNRCENSNTLLRFRYRIKLGNEPKVF